MKGLPFVAIGVTLAALTAGAEAQPGRMRLAHGGYGSYADGDWEHVHPPLKRRSARARKRRRTADRPVRGSRLGRTVERRPANARGFVAFSRKAGTSRACLTPAARDLLARIEAQFGRVGIVSTCRPGAVIAGTGRASRHASGNAIDFKAPAGKKAELVRWLIANHHAGGVMTYARMDHIHVDIGHRFVSLGWGPSRPLALRRSE